MVGFIPVLVALQISFVVGGMVAVVLLVLRLRRRRSYIPFGSFLVGAGMVVLFWGQVILDWYQTLLPG